MLIPSIADAGVMKEMVAVQFDKYITGGEIFEANHTISIDITLRKAESLGIRTRNRMHRKEAFQNIGFCGRAWFLVRVRATARGPP
jgi:hypothetical protein